MDEKKTKLSQGKRNLMILVLVLFIASVSYRLLGHWQLKQTSLLFVVLPAVIALLLIKYNKKPTTSFGKRRTL